MEVLLGVRAHMDIVVDLVEEEFSCGRSERAGDTQCKSREKRKKKRGGLHHLTAVLAF